MRETAVDLERLRAILDRSIERPSPFLRTSFYEGRTMAVIVHGRAEALGPEEEPVEEIEEIRLAAGGQSIAEWSGDPIFLRVEPDVIYTCAA